MRARNRDDPKPIEIDIEASGEVEYSIKKGDSRWQPKLQLTGSAESAGP